MRASMADWMRFVREISFEQVWDRAVDHADYEPAC
jgi:hypothetical protein